MHGDAGSLHTEIGSPQLQCTKHINKHVAYAFESRAIEAGIARGRYSLVAPVHAQRCQVISSCRKGFWAQTAPCCPRLTFIRQNHGHCDPGAQDFGDRFNDGGAPFPKQTARPAHRVLGPRVHLQRRRQAAGGSYEQDMAV